MFFSLVTAGCASRWCQGCGIAHSGTRGSNWVCCDLILFVPLILYIYSMHIVWVRVTSHRMSSSMHMASGCCLRDADIKTPMMHVPYLGGSLRANFNIKLFHASSRLVYPLHAQRIRSSLNFHYHSSSAMWALSMTVFFYVLQGILIIIIKNSWFHIGFAHCAKTYCQTECDGRSGSVCEDRAFSKTVQRRHFRISVGA